MEEIVKCSPIITCVQCPVGFPNFSGIYCAHRKVQLYQGENGWNKNESIHPDCKLPNWSEIVNGMHSKRI